MAKVRITRLNWRDTDDPVGNYYVDVELEIDGKRKRYSQRTPSIERAIELAYFFHTGNVVDWQHTLDGRNEPRFIDVPADMDGFPDLERVPPWVSLPE